MMSQTTQEILLGGYVPYNDFAALIKAFKIPPDAEPLMLLEMQPRSIVKPGQRQDLLLFSKFKPETDIAAYTSGRIFHIHGELRWERQEANIQVVYTGDRAYAPALNDSKKENLDAHNAVTRSYLLFGKRLDTEQLKRIGPEAQPGDFAEVRIPRLLRYPTLDILAGAQRIQLDVCEYIDSDTGVNIAYRFKKLVPFQKSQEQEKEKV